MKNKIIKISFAALVLIAYIGVVNALVELDSVSFDPAIIAAGDEVDITLNFHDRAFEDTFTQDKETTLNVYLETADSVSGEYLLITDATGSPNVGHLFAQGIWRKTLSVYSGLFTLISLELPGDTISRKLTVMSTSSPAASIAGSKLIPSTLMFALTMLVNKTSKTITKNILIVFFIFLPPSFFS